MIHIPLQSGGTCIQYYLSAAAQQLLQWLVGVAVLYHVIMSPSGMINLANQVSPVQSVWYYTYYNLANQNMLPHLSADWS